LFGFPIVIANRKVILVVSGKLKESEDESYLECILQEKPLSSIDLENIIKNFVRNGCKNEQSLIDFKESFEDSLKHWLDLCKDIVAANNSEGSLLIFGIDNCGNVVACPLCCKISAKSRVKSRRAVNEITASYFFTRFNN
jgi:hypothetical protein